MNEGYVKDSKEFYAYRDGRLYVQHALLDEGKAESVEVKEFILKFLKIHGDINVEIK